MPHWWEKDDDYFEEWERPTITIKPVRNPNKFGPLYYMSVPNIENCWITSKQLSRCDVCGKPLEKRPPNLPFTDSCLLDGLDMFYSSTATSFIISNRIREIILDNKFTNVDINELEIYQ
jgi:hypothetical protein